LHANDLPTHGKPPAIHQLIVQLLLGFIHHHLGIIVQLPRKLLVLLLLWRVNS
jgi:hypothetical protein